MSTRSTSKDTSGTISGKVFDWIKKQEQHEEILQSLSHQITLEQSSINELKEKPGYFEFKCRICHSKVFLPRKTSSLTVITNTHRHLKNSCCLKKANPKSATSTKNKISTFCCPSTPKSKCPSKVIDIDEHDEAANRRRPPEVIDIDEHDEVVNRRRPPEGTIDFIKNVPYESGESGKKDPNESGVSSKRLKLENDASDISFLQDISAECSTLHRLAGH